MASFAIGRSKLFIERNYNRLKPFLQQETAVLNPARNNHMFKHLQLEKEHDTKYKFEVTSDPKEWEYVEKLMPLLTVPVPKPKPCYPSGWRPSSDEALKHPYFVERSCNHMLSVYLKCYENGRRKVTKVNRIHGDLWRLHDELKAHLEEKFGKKIASSVEEGNNVIIFKGDHVYYVEQWLLSKGF